MRSWVFLVLLLCSVCVAAQNVAINADGSDPNSNAALDISSPATGQGRGLLIPRMTEAQRTTNGSAGGLLDGSGNLHGGAAQGLIVYQTDGTQGIYYNTSTTAVPSWIYLGTPTLPIEGTTVALGNSANVSNNGIAVGVNANATNTGSAVGHAANSSNYGAAFGYKANGTDCNVAVGYCANSYTGMGPYSGSVSVGYRANSFSGDGKYTGGVAIGYTANARHNFNENDSGAVAVGFKANSFIRGVGVGYKAAGYNQGAAVGFHATGSNSGSALGYCANGYYYGTAIGYMANSGNKHYSIAKGPYSKCTRYNEEWKSSDGSDNKYGYGQANYHGATTTGSATEIYLGGTSSQRFILQNNSAVGFRAIVTAINSTTGDSSVWHLAGGIKRRSGANTIAMIGSVSTVHSATQGGLTTTPSFTADTVYGSLKLRVTGVNSNTVRWNATVEYSEARQ